MHETGAMHNPFFPGMYRLLVGGLNKDHAVWLTGASLPTPVSHHPLGG